MLLDAGANPDPADENGETPLLLASATGNETVARLLLKAGASVDARRWSGDTPLHAAIYGGSIDIVQLLLDRGADLNVVEHRMGHTPLMWALARRQPEMAELLIRRGANVSAVSTNGFRPIHFAAQQADTASAQALIAAGARPHVPTADGRTAFLMALAQGSEEMTRLMLDHGADVQARDANGATPLHGAVRQGLLELARDFVNLGAVVNARTETSDEDSGSASRHRGLTPFLTAARSASVDMMRMLLAVGADPTAKTSDDAGAVLLATESRELGAVQMLIRLGLDVNVAPPVRPTALHTAIRFGDDEIVVYLAAHGADFDARDHHGRTPLEEAEFEAPTDTITLMRRLAAERERTGSQ